MRLGAELRRRNVYRMAALYAAIAWLIMQATDVVKDLANLPDWIGPAVLALLAIGFPIALVFSWLYALTPAGITREEDVDSSNPTTPIAGRRLDLIIISLLSAAVVMFAYDKWWSASTSKQSIAVLAFANLSNDPDNEYFSDGLSEEILNLLAKVPSLKVIGRASSFAFKGTDTDLRDIGQTLGVSTLLDGSVRKSGNQVRISAQLIDVSDGTHIWAETYDRPLIDIFVVQDNVAAAIIEALQVHIEAEPTRGHPTDNPEAYTLFLKAKIAEYNFDWRTCELLLSQAIGLDPDFAEAHELLAYAYSRMEGNELGAVESRVLSSRAAENALAIDPDLVLARALYDIGRTNEYSRLREIEALDLAARKDPSDQRILDLLFFNLFLTGYMEEALAIAERTVDIDPLSPHANGRLPAAYFAVGRTEEGFAALDVLAQLESGSIHWYIGEANLVFERDLVAKTHFEAELLDWGVVSTSWLSDLIVEGRKPTTGRAYLDQHISLIVDSQPSDSQELLGNFLIYWYLFFEHLDRYFEILSALDENGADLLSTGHAYPQLGFTTHPGYLEAAESLGVVEVWDNRGPPDFCRKTNDQWVCE